MIRKCVPDNILEIFSHISLSDISGCSTVSRRSQFEAWSRFDSLAPDLRVSLQSLSLPHLHTDHSQSVNISNMHGGSFPPKIHLFMGLSTIKQKTSPFLSDFLSLRLTFFYRIYYRFWRLYSCKTSP